MNYSKHLFISFLLYSEILYVFMYLETTHSSSLGHVATSVYLCMYHFLNFKFLYILLLYTVYIQYIPLYFC